MRDAEQASNTNPHRPSSRSEEAPLTGADNLVERRDIANESPGPLPESRTALTGIADESVPHALRKKYLVADGSFYFRDRQNKLAFVHKGRRLATPHSDADTATSMVLLAEAQGWKDIALRGNTEFCREAWLQAAVRGIEVRGFSPQPEDRARLAEMRGRHPTPEARPGIDPQQDLITRTLQFVLKVKGHTANTVNASAEIAAQRLHQMHASGSPLPRIKIFDNYAAPAGPSQSARPAYRTTDTQTRPGHERTRNRK